MKPEVTRHGILDMQICVPDDWTNERAEEFANAAYPCGTRVGWQIRKAGSNLLAGAPERNPCEDRDGCVHITLDA